MPELQASDMKPFIGLRDFEEAQAFYLALGCKVNWEDNNLALLQLGSCYFYLQRYYEKQWCENTMLHITVNDAEARYQYISDVLAAKTYGGARVNPPKKEDYGALVTYVWDPAGNLLHLAQS